MSILVCLTAVVATAQESNKTRIGIKGGVNFSNLYTEDADDTNMRTGFNAGLFAKLPLTNMFAIQPELFYSTKGSEVTYKNTFVDGTANFNLNYIEVPVLLVVNITDNFNLHFGPYFSYLISGKVKNKSNVNLFDFEDNIDPEDYNRFDAGVAAGVAVDLGGISIGARYNHGLKTVGKERDFLGTNYTFPDAVNGVLSVYASVSFN